MAEGFIEWGGPEEGPPERPFVRVWTVKPHASLIGYVLSPNVVTCRTHYVPNPAKPGMYHTRPHVKPATLCDGCRMLRPLRRYGYVAVQLRPPRSSVGIVELTAEALRSCPALFDVSRTLRGREITVERTGNARNTRCTAFLSNDYTDHPLAQEPDVMRELMRLWGYEDVTPTDQLIQALDDQLGRRNGEVR